MVNSTQEEEEEWFTESDNRIQKEEQELSWMEGRKGHIWWDGSVEYNSESVTVHFGIQH